MEGFKSIVKMKVGGSVKSEYCGGGRAMKKKEGGKIDATEQAEDKKIVKKAIAMHDKQEHDGEKTDLSKLKKGGRAKKEKGTVKKFADGGATGPLSAVADLAKRVYKRGKRNLLGTDAQNAQAAADQAARAAQEQASSQMQGQGAITDNEQNTVQQATQAPAVPGQKRGGKVKGKK